MKLVTKGNIQTTPESQVPCLMM